MIAIIGAMEIEIANLLEKCSNTQEKKYGEHIFYHTYLAGKEVVITQLGIGKVNAAINLTLLLTHFKVDFVINTGIAGGLLPLSINDVVVSDKIYYYDVDIRFFGYDYGQVAGEPKCYQADGKIQQLVMKHSSCHVVNICSGDKFVTNTDQLNDILAVDDSILVADMESAALAHVAHRFKVPFIVIRAISDIINDHNQLEKYDEAKTTQKSQQILMDLLVQI
jgi:adenosylhomocysteine nucleosidase